MWVFGDFEGVAWMEDTFFETGAWRLWSFEPSHVFVV